jgi:hypothetical protein
LILKSNSDVALAERDAKASKNGNIDRYILASSEAFIS